MRNKLCLVAWATLVGLGSLGAGHASAALLPITNASFEADPMYTWSATGWTKPSWWTQVLVEGDGFIVPHTAPADGNLHVDLGPGAALISNDTFILTTGDVGSLVTLTVAIGNRAVLASVAPSDATIAIQLDGADVAGAALSTYPADGGWLDLTATYTVTAADVGKALGVKIADVGSGYFDNNRIEADNVRLDLSAVPEPASLGLLSLSGLLLMRRRK